MRWPSCPHGPVQAYLSGRPLQSDMSLPSICPRCPVLAVSSWLSCHVCPVLVVLSQLSQSFLLAVFSWLSCYGHPVFVVLSQLSCLVFSYCPVYLSCHGSPATFVLSQLSSPAACPTCHVPAAFLSTLVPQFSICAGVLTVLSQLSCPGCLAVMSLL